LIFTIGRPPQPFQYYQFGTTLIGQNKNNEALDIFKAMAEKPACSFVDILRWNFKTKMRTWHK